MYLFKSKKKKSKKILKPKLRQHAAVVKGSDRTSARTEPRFAILAV